MKIKLLALLLTLSMTSVQAHEGEHADSDHGTEELQLSPNTGVADGYTWSSSCEEGDKMLGLFIYEAGSVDAENFGYLASLNKGGLCAMVVSIEQHEDNDNGWDFTTDYMQNILTEGRAYVKEHKTTLNFMPIIDPVTDTYL